MTTIESNTLKGFIKEVVAATEQDKDISAHINVVGSGITPMARCSRFFITTMESDKVYSAIGVTGLVAQVVEFTKQERRVRDIQPVGISKASLLNAKYSVEVLEPVETVEPPLEEIGATLPVDSENLSEDSTELPSEIIEDPYGINIKINSKHPLYEKSQKELFQMVKDRSLKGNNQMPKKKLIEIIVGYESEKLMGVSEETVEGSEDETF